MAESLFVLVIIFTAYVFYSRANEAQATTTSEEPEQPPTKSVATKAIQPTVVKPEIPVSSKSKPKSSAKATASAPKTSPIKATPLKSVPKVMGKLTAPTTAKKVVPAQITPNTNLGKISLKNPITGEIDAPHSNYRFTKRWIKEALVTEGLLDKVYKNTELDGAVEKRIKAAVSKLEAMDNYRA